MSLDPKSRHRTSVRGKTRIGGWVHGAKILLAASAVSQVVRLVIISQAGVHPVYAEVRFLEFLVATIVIQVGCNAGEFARNFPAALLVQLLAPLVQSIAHPKAGIRISRRLSSRG